MFGLFGMFNVDAVESVEFYRGSIPARYGGSLSGVVDVRPRIGGASRPRVSGGLSLLGARVLADGPLPWGGDTRWMVGGRSSISEIVGSSSSYVFRDFNFGLQTNPSDTHRLRFSLVTSTDDFRYNILQNDLSRTLRSDWLNVVSSLSWSWVPSDRFVSEATTYHSKYRGVMRTGGTTESPSTFSEISAFGFRAGLTAKGEASGARAGVAVEGANVDLLGQGGYLHDAAAGSYLHLSAFLEAEHWFGPVRIAPGIRVNAEARSSRWFVEPRFAVRYKNDFFALSATVDRTHQFLSILRDSYSPVPGAPMWFLHDSDRPVSSADGVSLAFDSWVSDEWTVSLVGWARRFRETPRWLPARARDFSELEFHDGNGKGVEATLRKYGGQINGWVSYQLMRVRYGDGLEAEYRPDWDRRHEVDANVSAGVWRSLTASLRATVGSGTPFWLPAGNFNIYIYDPHTRIIDDGSERVSNFGEPGSPPRIPVWLDKQGQVPSYVRFDGAIRYEFGWGSWTVVPFLSVVNVFGRENALFYSGFALAPDADTFGSLENLPLNYRPVTGWGRFPFVGIDFRF